MKTLSVAVCLLEHEGKIALIQFKRNYLTGYWGLPGGKFDDSEYLPEAAVREIKEEVEIDVAFGELLGIVDEIVESPESTMRIILHVCTVVPVGEPELKRIDKAEGVIDWFTRDQIMAMQEQFVASDYQIIQSATLGTLAAYTKCRQVITADGVILDRFEAL